MWEAPALTATATPHVRRVFWTPVVAGALAHILQEVRGVIETSTQTVVSAVHRGHYMLIVYLSLASNCSYSQPS